MLPLILRYQLSGRCPAGGVQGCGAGLLGGGLGKPG